MKNIKLNSAINKSADNIINAIENRAKRQSQIYTALFVLLAIVIAAIVIHNLSIEEYDGYVSHHDIQMRAVDNMAIVDYYVKPGDIVNEGDTLYSCLMIDWLEDQVNPFSENVAAEKRRESDLRIAKYRSEIIEVNNTISSLRAVIKKVDDEIRSGVKTADELDGLNMELTARVERSRHLERAIKAEYEMQSEYSHTISNHSSLISQGLSKRRTNLKQYGKALRYRVAYVDSKIINIKASMGMITLKHEEVLSFQPIGHPDMTDGHIKMIIKASDYEHVYDGMEVEVSAGDELIGKANVSFLGSRMAESYAHLETVLDSSTDLNGLLLVRLDLQEEYELPEKYVIDNYPVRIRYHAWDDFEKRRRK